MIGYAGQHLRHGRYGFATHFLINELGRHMPKRFRRTVDGSPAKFGVDEFRRNGIKCSAVCLTGQEPERTRPQRLRHQHHVIETKRDSQSCFAHNPVTMLFRDGLEKMPDRVQVCRTVRPGVFLGKVRRPFQCLKADIVGFKLRRDPVKRTGIILECGVANRGTSQFFWDELQGEAVLANGQRTEIRRSQRFRHEFERHAVILNGRSAKCFRSQSHRNMSER